MKITKDMKPLGKLVAPLKRDPRQHLYGVHLEHQDGKNAAVVTNGRAMVVRQWESEPEPKMATTMHFDSWNLCTRTDFSVTPVGKKSVNVVNGILTGKYTAIDGRFPEWQEVVPTYPETVVPSEKQRAAKAVSVCFDAKLLIQVLNSMDNGDGQQPMTFVIPVDGVGPMVIERKKADLNITGVLIPFRR